MALGGRSQRCGVWSVSDTTPYCTHFVALTAAEITTGSTGSGDTSTPRGSQPGPHVTSDVRCPISLAALGLVLVLDLIGELLAVLEDRVVRIVHEVAQQLLVRHLNSRICSVHLLFRHRDVGQDDIGLLLVNLSDNLWHASD